MEALPAAVGVIVVLDGAMMNPKILGLCMSNIVLHSDFQGMSRCAVGLMNQSMKR